MKLYVIYLFYLISENTLAHYPYLYGFQGTFRTWGGGISVHACGQWNDANFMGIYTN